MVSLLCFKAGATLHFTQTLLEQHIEEMTSNQVLENRFDRAFSFNQNQPRSIKLQRN